MSAEHTYLALFLSDRTGERMAQWLALPEAERKAKEREGFFAWKAWTETHAGAVVDGGGPLGKTKRVDGGGAHDVTNAMSAFTVVRAASHAEAAAMFEGHPHFAIFPGEAVEVMPIMPIPGS